MACRPAVHSNKLFLAEMEAALAEERGSSLAGSTLTEAQCWLVMLCCVACAACELGRVRCRMCCAVARGLAHEVGGAYETGCGRQCLSTAVLDTDRFNLVVRPKGAVHRVEAVARATASRGRPIQAKRRASIPCARGSGRVKQLQADSTCIPVLVCGPTLRGHAGAISSFIWPRRAC